MENFTPIPAFLGGAMIGTSASLLLLFNGRITGISGIMSQIFYTSSKNELSWRLLFLCGLVLGAICFNYLYPNLFEPRQDYPLFLLIASGFLVGIGTRMGNGCTSGHGICGIANFSHRSIFATLTFMISGMASVYFFRHILEINV